MKRIVAVLVFALAGCSPQGQAILDKDIGALLARCGGDIMFGGVAITGHITCPVPKVAP